MDNNSNPFSDDNLRAQLDKLTDHGGEVAIGANQDGAQIAVDVALVDQKVKWSLGGWAKSTWNGAVDWMGVTRLRW